MQVFVQAIDGKGKLIYESDAFDVNSLDFILEKVKIEAPTAIRIIIDVALPVVRRKRPNFPSYQGRTL